MKSTEHTYTSTVCEELLPAVSKPSRYINREINSHYNYPDPEKVNFCLAFPDVYEVGFSHLGLKILYSILNGEQDATADRVYAPWIDFSELLQKKKIPLFSLENRVPLKEFDVIGFTLQSELTYTNLLAMLDLSEVALFAKDRVEDDPLIIAGGICSGNPEPLALFIDAFFIGEAEEGIIEMKDILWRSKQKKLTRKETLQQLQSIESVYVPSLYHSENGRVVPVSEDFPSEINVRKYDSFSEKNNYINQLVSWQQTTHDRYITEIMRGCSRGCRFCYAGYFYRPVRERKIDDIIGQLLSEVKEQGWEEAALLSLSSTDYTCIKELLIELYSQLDEQETNLSLPSLRVDSLDDNILKLMNSLRQNGITIAPEAGSQRLRNIINKDFDEEQILKLVQLAAENRWRILKLYFMIGLPWETEDDIEQIGDLIDKIMRVSEKRLLINITISPFVPKPHTPFQWSEMLSRETLLQRIYHVKKRISKYKKIKIKYHDIDASYLECLLNRGDRSTGHLILGAYSNGARFDGWDECFDFAYWEKSAESLQMNFDRFQRSFSLNETLPWQHINTGISTRFLTAEYHKAEKEAITEDCRNGKCSSCGVCRNGLKPFYSGDSREPLFNVNKELPNNTPGFRYRIIYSKTGLLRFVSHLDTLRMIHRFLRASGLPIIYTQGFNRHPKIHFGPPLPVGVEGENEILDIEMAKPMKSKKVLECLKKVSFLKSNKSSIDFSNSNKEREENIRDWNWKAVFQPDLDELAKLDLYDKEHYQISFPEHYQETFQNKLLEYSDKAEWVLTRERKGKTRIVNLKDIILSIAVKENILIIYKQLSGATVYDIIDSLFGIKREDTGRFEIIRKELLVTLSPEPIIGSKTEKSYD